MVLGVIALVGCGATPSAQLSIDATTLTTCEGATARDGGIELSNAGAAPLHWSARIEPLSAPFDLSTTSGEVAPKAVVHLAVVGKQPPGELGKSWEGTLHITTDDPEHPSFDVPLHLETRGAVLTSPTFALDFGEMPIGAATPALAAAFENSGNAPVTLGLPAVGSAFQLAFSSGEPTAKVLPGEKVTVKATFTANALGDVVAKWRPTIADGAVCGGVPEGPPLRGKGVEGVIGVSPGVVSLQSACGGGGDRASLFVINTSKQPVPFDASPVGIASHVALDVVDGVIPAESKVDLGVRVTQLPRDASLAPDAYGDDVVVHTLAPADAPHTVHTSVSARGAHLAPLTNLILGKWVVPEPLTGSIKLTNDGNEAMTLSLSVPRPFDVPASITLPAGQTLPLTVGLIPTVLPLAVPITEAIDIGVTTNNACQLAPPTVTATVTLAQRETVAVTGGATSCAVGHGGVPYCWGFNNYGQVGDGTVSNWVNTPVPVKGLSNITHIAVGAGSSCARRSDDTVWCWGNNSEGQLGDTGIQSSPTPRQVYFPGNGMLDVVGTSGHFCGRVSFPTPATQVVCWGRNLSNQISWGGTPFYTTPQWVGGAKQAHHLATSYMRTCWLDGSSLVCTTTGGAYPPPIGLQWLDLVGYEGGFCGQVVGGNAPLCFGGSNLYGDLGPTGPFGPWDQLSGGAGNSLALVQGTLYRWGQGSYFQQSDSSIPVLVPGGTSVAKVYLGALNVLARMQDGTLRSFGNYQAQPQAVPGFD